MTEPRWTPNPGKRPRTGEKLLRIKWANGEESKHLYRADQLRWSITGHDFDVGECARV